MQRLHPIAKLLVGAVVGLLASLALLPIVRPLPPAPPTVGPAFAVPDDQGQLEHIVLHYTIAAGDLLLPTYSQLLTALDPSIEVAVVVEDQAAFDDLVARLRAAGVEREGLHAVETGFAITPWSRDRYTLASAGAEHWLLVIPEKSDGEVQERVNDWMVPWALAEALEGVEVRTLPIRFDGGDLLVTESHIFVSYRLVEKNVGLLVESREALVALLERSFGRPVFLFGEGPGTVPYHHVGMYITPLPDGRVVIGDPDLGLSLLDLSDAERMSELGVDQSEATLQLFRNVIAAFEAGGFEVVRMPLLPLQGGVDYITYNNLLMEVRDGRTVAFVPTYGLDDLDRLALQRFAELGVEAHGIDVSRVYRYHGSVRCLVNVLRRSV